VWVAALIRIHGSVGRSAVSVVAWTGAAYAPPGGCSRLSRLSLHLPASPARIASQDRTRLFPDAYDYVSFLHELGTQLRSLSCATISSAYVLHRLGDTLDLSWAAIVLSTPRAAGPQLSIVWGSSPDDLHTRFGQSQDVPLVADGQIIGKLCVGPSDTISSYCRKIARSSPRLPFGSGCVQTVADRAIACTAHGASARSNRAALCRALMRVQERTTVALLTCTRSAATSDPACPRDRRGLEATGRPAGCGRQRTRSHLTPRICAGRRPAEARRARLLAA